MSSHGQLLVNNTKTLETSDSDLILPSVVLLLLKILAPLFSLLNNFVEA